MDLEINKDLYISDNDYKLGDLIQERGSNENGYYMKFSNGVMICTKTITLSNIECNTAWGSMYETSRLNLGQYAQQFIVRPWISYSLINQNAGFIEDLYSQTNSNIGSIVIARPVSGKIKVEIHIIAIGFWK